MCGIVGITSRGFLDISEDLAISTEGLKHRGDDSVGAFMYYNGELQDIVKRRRVTPKLLQQIRLMGPEEGEVGPNEKIIALGQTRYTTSRGKARALNSQPYTVADDDSQLDLIFNGNIADHERVRREHLEKYTYSTRGDTETLSRFIFHNIEAILRQSGQSNVRNAIEETVKRVLAVFRGGYSVIAKYGKEEFIFKDMYGIRPLSYGDKGEGYHIFSSEPYFYDRIGYTYRGELPNGSLIFPGCEPVSLLTENISQRPDVFEFVYLAKDDSILYGVEVRKVRFDLGFSAASELRENHPDWEFDHIMGVPNGANIMREGVCKAYGFDPSIPNGMIRKPYSGRSFMAGTQKEREQMVRDKFLIDPSQVGGKRILLVDDSIVRGTTMKIIVDMLLEAGALSVTVLSASPIVHYGDKYGIAMSTNELIGINHTDGRHLNCQQIEEELFYDSKLGRQKARLFYPSVPNFLDVFKKHNMPNVHAGYFTGEFCYDMN